MTKNKHYGSKLSDLIRGELKDANFRRAYEKARLDLEVGEMVRHITKQKKLSIRQLAKKMNTDASLVRRLMENKNVTLSTLAKFSAATGKKIQIYFE